MNVEKLEKSGFKLVEIKEAKLQRHKASGGMYEASAIMKRDNTTLHLFMFNHLPYTTSTISLDETKKHLEIKQLDVDDVSYDTNWHCKSTTNRATGGKNDDLWLHKEGWFNTQDKSLSVFMDKHGWHRFPLYAEDLTKLGFIQIF